MSTPRNGICPAALLTSAVPWSPCWITATTPSNFFFQGLSQILQEEYGVAKVILETKFTSTKPADPDLINSMSQQADFMVAGVCL